MFENAFDRALVRYLRSKGYKIRKKFPPHTHRRGSRMRYPRLKRIGRGILGATLGGLGGLFIPPELLRPLVESPDTWTKIKEMLDVVEPEDDPIFEEAKESAPEPSPAENLREIIDMIQTNEAGMGRYNDTMRGRDLSDDVHVELFQGGEFSIGKDVKIQEWHGEDVPDYIQLMRAARIFPREDYMQRWRIVQKGAKLAQGTLVWPLTHPAKPPVTK